jgi:hypothetical protein
VLGRVDSVEGYHGTRSYPGAEHPPGLVIYRFDGPGSGRSTAGWFPTGAQREQAWGGRAAEVRHNQVQGAGVLGYPLSQRVAGSSRFGNVRGGAEPAAVDQGDRDAGRVIQRVITRSG